MDHTIPTTAHYHDDFEPTPADGSTERSDDDAATGSSYSEEMPLFSV